MKPVTFSVFKKEFRSAIKKEIEEKIGFNSNILNLLDMKKIDEKAGEEYEEYRETFHEYPTEISKYIETIIGSYL